MNVPFPAADARNAYKRATVCIWFGARDDEAAFQAWLKTWGPRMVFVSDSYGYGSCVHLYDVLGPHEGIDAIPPQLRLLPEWTED